MSDIVERAYIAVSEDYCQGTEWCWSGVGEPLRRFADIVVLSETEALRDENARLREALKHWDALIRHQYTGSREAMSDMTYCAQETAKLLFGDDPWPKIETSAAMGAKG